METDIVRYGYQLTVKEDRNEKMPLYAREGVRWAWLIDPIARTLEVYVLGEGRRWKEPSIHRGDARVRAQDQT